MTSTARFVPEGARPWWPFSIGTWRGNRRPPRTANLLLARGVVEGALHLQPTEQRALWRTWPRETLASLMHTPGAGVGHPSRDFILSMIGPDDSVLDVGCGAGVTYEVLAAAGRAGQYVGVDSSEPSIELAREFYPAGEFRVGEAEALTQQFASRSFDVVVVRHVLEHLPDFELAMREAVTVARRVAIFVFFLTPRSLPLGIRKLDPRISSPFYAYIYSRSAIDAFVRETFGVHGHWYHGLGPSRTEWLRGELNSALIVTRDGSSPSR